MEKTKKYYTSDLIDGAIEDLQDNIQWCKEEKEDYEIDDLIHEIADNNIPIYTYDLLQYASNNFDLIQPSELQRFNPSVVNIIQANIYEVLTEALYEYINEQNEGDNNG